MYSVICKGTLYVQSTTVTINCSIAKWAIQNWHFKMQQLRAARLRFLKVLKMDILLTVHTNTRINTDKYVLLSIYINLQVILQRCIKYEILAVKNYTEILVKKLKARYNNTISTVLANLLYY